ncbi:hypothetical protein BDB01DRAFT_836127 [Pilobolus umbonatus]|nr:hypothetical protein BDB01DRAFT_836127 [Pilobolus umbonatus]
MDKDTQLAKLLNIGFDLEKSQQAVEHTHTLDEAIEWILTQVDTQVNTPVDTLPELSCTPYKVKLLDGSNIRHVYSLDTPMSVIFQDVLRVENTPSIRLMSTFPSRVYEMDNTTIREAGILSNMTLHTQSTERMEIAHDVSEEDHVSEDEEIEEAEIVEPEERREAAYRAIIEREQPVVASKRIELSKKSVKALKDISMECVTKLLSQHSVQSQRHLRHIICLSPTVAEGLIIHLIKAGRLNVSTLRRLSDHCYLQHVILDSYSYCTDSLIEYLCQSNSNRSVIHLSLRGCDILTDASILYLEELQQLHYLDLSKTKITSRGLLSLIQHGIPNIEVLILDGCLSIQSNHLLSVIFNECAYLNRLSLVSIPLSQQEYTCHQHPLTYLNISQTDIDDRGLIQLLKRTSHLTELKLTGCSHLTTHSLACLPTRYILVLSHLSRIYFPNREHDLNDTLMRYKGLPLDHLDLSGYLNISTLDSLAHIKQLTYLNLNGTKLTDEGMAYVKGLSRLQQLYLDKTLVTEEGLSQLIGLPHLDTLSLSYTQVTNAILHLFGDFDQTSFTRTIRTLNLSHCSLISDEGIPGLKGMSNLTHLILDHTHVSEYCVEYLRDLPYLKQVRLQCLQPA